MKIQRDISVHMYRQDVAKASRGMFVTLLFFVGLCALARCTAGCDAFSGAQAPNAKEQSYTARIVGCAATAKTRAEDHACRVQVNRDYGLCSGNPSELPGDCS